ncbi:hypothetical protein J2801_002210 [Paraburkholderia phenoliruptrix]|uniref:hypothetical protein n=1 Tax=Paraburkholderia phenoliruptrix TaxID=252970 RepID=UPI00285F80A2|nr:hypothetical protein [Paraburkholderia phenoliruptrix]MDR6419959.1 hypothetical protein [Paraburkholderia phenoliruptrix]
MNRDDSASRDTHSLQSSTWRCGAIAGFFMLMVQQQASSPEESSVCKQLSWAPGDLAAEAARAFQQASGHAASAIAPAATTYESAALPKLLTGGGSSAAVILLDADVLGRILRPCDWKGPLLRIRNRLADEGVKVFSALALPGRSGIVSAARAQLSSRRVERFCSLDGIGFLGTVNSVPETIGSVQTSVFHERAGVAIGHRLASAAFFCCDAFRISAPRSLT